MAKPEPWIAETLAKFRKVSGGGNPPKRWDAMCPVHEDEKPSLSITLSHTGVLLLCCMAPCKCDFQSILNAAGLVTQDLYPPDRRKHKRIHDMATQQQLKFIKAYDYRDEAGILKYQVLRWEPKRFNQRHPNPKFDPKLPEAKETNPKWINSMEGVTRILYKLPELKAALLDKPDRVIFFLEGEKDVDLARENDIVATTNPLGALKFYPEYAQHFMGANVFVFADNDAVDTTCGFSPGIRHAEEVCALLKPVAASVRMAVFPGAPKKGDFTEFWVRSITTGREPAAIRRELFELYKATPVWEPNVQEPERKPAEAPSQKFDSKPAEEKPKAPEPGERDEKAKLDAKKSEKRVDLGTVSERRPVKLDDALATIRQRAEVLASLKGTRSTAELIGSLDLTLLALRIELTRLPGQVDGDTVNDGLVTLAAMCIEYLTAGA